jgi:hypothetical protein
MDSYENDRDISELVYTELTDEKLLKFFFKKGGKVNINNLALLVHQYGKKEIAHNVVSLETLGLIKPVSNFEYAVTNKARWQRIRDSKTLIFGGIIAAIIATLILLLQVVRIL